MNTNSVMRGRGAVSNPAGRFEKLERVPVDDGWTPDELPGQVPTAIRAESVGKIITRNDSPDIPFDRSINPYRGCEHGCIYCYARPSHAYLNLSPGLDFETRIVYKADAVTALERELSAPGYVCEPITLGANTDPYQPLERRLRITRGLLEVMHDCNQPVTIVTKSTLVERDLDLLAPMAEKGLCAVALSITTLDAPLKRVMEPRAAAPRRRLQTMKRLSEAGIPVSLLLAPIIPAINDAEIERIVAASRDAGAGGASYVLLRLPHELVGLFEDWLAVHYPDRAAHVMSLVRQTRGGRSYDSRFGYRQRGTGPYAAVIRARFRGACRRAGFEAKARPPLQTQHFQPPERPGQQLRLI